MKIKNTFKWVGIIIQVALIVVAAVLHYLSNKKMGVMRSLTYRNSVWNNLNLRSWIICILVLLLLLFIVLAFIKYKKSLKIKYFIIVIVVNVLSLIFTISVNSKEMLSYYVIIIGVVSVLIIEALKISFLQPNK